MNKVFLKQEYIKLSNEQLSDFVNHVIKPNDFEYRLFGNLCRCNGNGEFELLLKNSEVVIEGGKYYMKCRKCGDVSHL